jgi:hypothetical protein
LVQRLAPGQTSGRISLAHLATLYPNGGKLTFVVQGLEMALASFQRPLTPTFISLDGSDAYESVVLTFADQVRCVRPRLRELVSNKQAEFDGSRFGMSGHCLFCTEGMPTVECTNVCGNLGHESEFCRISLDVPKAGWPPGIWVAEIEVRRDETHGWQPVRDDRGGHASLIWLQPPDKPLNDARSHAIWWAAGRALVSEHVPDNPPDFANETRMLADLLAECEVLLSGGYSAATWPRIEWVQALAGELARQAADQIDSDDGTLRRSLLAVVAREPEITPCSLLVGIPALLASPGRFLEVLGRDGELLSALRWCAALSSRTTVWESLRDCLMECFQNSRVGGFLTTLQHFQNFVAVVQGEVNATAYDFARFDFQRYWQQTISPIQTPPDEVGWSEREALGRPHVHATIAALLGRRRQEEGGQGLASAAAVFALADDFRRWLRGALGARAAFMPDSAWDRPWLEVDIPDDALAGECARFCSVFSLAARASAAGWLRFAEVMNWLHAQRGISATSKAVATLVCLAPELSGYHLMFWELICRTSRHD